MGAVGIWDYARAVYAAPGFSAAALRVQDECGADVCVLIWLLWRGRGVTAAGLRVVLDEIAPWRQAVVLPLRAARRGMKGVPGAEGVRERVAALEIEAEREQLERLAGMTVAEGEGDGLSVYAAVLGAVFPADALTGLRCASV